MSRAPPRAALRSPPSRRWLAGPRQPLRTPPASPITPAPPEPQAPAFRCLTYVRNQKDPAVRRGAVCKALACVVPSPCPWVCAWRPLLAHALKACFGQDLPGQTRVVEDLHRTLAALYREYSAAAPPALRPFVGRFCVGGAQFQSRAVRCEFRGRAFDLTLPIALTSEEIGLDGVSLRGLVGYATPPRPSPPPPPRPPPRAPTSGPLVQHPRVAPHSEPTSESVWQHRMQPWGTFCGGLWRDVEGSGRI